MAVFTAAEALEMAMEIEKNGELFYNEVAAKSDDLEVQALFEDLAAQERIHFQVGGKIKTGVSLLLRGRGFARQKMWALAALHLRSAVADMTNRTEAHWQLAMAYMHLERHDLADQVLLDAERIRPSDPQIQKLRELIASHQIADRRRS